jgi:hypothetical protein
VETDEADYKVHIGPLRMDGVMLETKDLADVLQECRGDCVDSDGVSHKKPLYGDGEIVDNTFKANIPTVYLVVTSVYTVGLSTYDMNRIAPLHEGTVLCLTL